MKKLMRYLFLTCRKSTEFMEKRSVFGLNMVERTQLLFHKMMCTACTQYEKQSSFLDRLLNKKDFKLNGHSTKTLGEDFIKGIKFKIEEK